MKINIDTTGLELPPTDTTNLNSTFMRGGNRPRTLDVPDIDPEIYPLVPDNHPVLRTECEKFDFQSDVDPWHLAVSMIQTMRSLNGIGLACNQIGHPLRVFVMEAGQSPIACFNPRVVDVSQEEILMDEGCLTYPELFVKIKRPRHIKVRFQDADGEVHNEKFTGMTARVFQHELDHLDGVIFYDRANRYHRDKAFKDWKLWQRHKKT